MAITRIEVHSDRPLEEEELLKIQDIFQNSQCPNESLTNSVAGFSSFDGYLLQIGSGDGYTACIEI